MSTEPTTERRIERWLVEDAPAQAPDRVLATTFDRTTATRQVRARRWRIPTLTPWQTSLAAAAAFLLAAVGGTALLTRTPGVPSVGAPGALAATCPASGPDPASAEGPPLGLAIVCLDGTVALDLGLPRDAWGADLSPDGTQVAFRTADLSAGVCAACQDPPFLTIVPVGARRGSFLLGSTAAQASQMAWSPDGGRIAFQGTGPDGNRDIYVSDIADLGLPRNGRLQTPTRLTDDPAIDEFPAWTPDGSTILYANMGSEPPDDSGFSSTLAIWSVPAEGGTPTRLTHPDVAAATMPDVAPDGTIAYLTGYGEIATMGPDGSDPTAVAADTGGRNFSPRWSPDGSMLAVLRYHPGERTVADPDFGITPGLALLDVVVIDPASGEVIDVGPRVATDYNPVGWTPDGQGLLVNRYLAD
jgi:dipeptidyl aminopeptidase/acylaminoacyl peptidase